LVKLFECSPVFRALVVDLAGHLIPIIRKLLVSKGDEKGSQPLPFLHRESLDLSLDFLNAHIRTIGNG